MSFRKPELVVTDINFDDDNDDAFTYDTHDSNPDEVLSQYSNSDLQEFNNFERDIYGSIDEPSLDDKNNGQHLQDDNHTSGDEVSDSLRLVLPNIQVKPYLGDPIQTYDQLRGQYKHEIPAKSEINSPIPSEFSQITPIEKRSSPFNPRAISQASIVSAETVLSQNEELEEPATLFIQVKSKSRNMPSSVSSTESNARQSSHRSQNKATQKILLDQEREIRKDQDKYIGHLQHTINQLLTKHALAEETIDQLRLGVVINTQNKYNDQRSQRRNSSATKKKVMSRRYSSFLDNANFQDYEEGLNIMSRAKSVDMSMFEEEPENTEFKHQPHSTNEFGGSMKQMANDPTKESEIANDIRTIGDYFQSRIKILNEAANNLQYSSSGRASVSSGSHNGDSSVLGKIVYDNQRHTPLAKRLKNLQMAYSDLQSDFNGFSQINRSNAPETTGHKDSGLHTVEGNLFELGMKIDDLERTIAESAAGDTPVDNRVFGSPTQANELINRFTNVEEQYENLMDRYNNLKGSRSPVRQRQMDEVVQQLQSLVAQVNGRYSTIPTPDKLESMMQKDIIDKIKQHLSSDSPPYFLTEEDGLSSGHSSFGRNHRRRHRVPARSDEDSYGKVPPVDRLSPIKSRISTHIPDDTRSPTQNVKPNSLPVSVVSSSSMWFGATSGETLALDDQGVLRDSVSRKANSSVGSEVFEDRRQSRRPSQPSIGGYNPRRKSDLSTANFVPSHHSPLHDDIKRLDEQLEKVELEEKRQNSAAVEAARDSDANLSRTTRSLLGTSPSNSIVSKHSRQPSGSVASSHKSRGTLSGHGRYGPGKTKRRVKSRYQVPDSVSDSENDTPSDEDYDYDYDNDTADYVKSAGCGLGPRSRYIRGKNKNVQDRWSQTPPVFNRRPSRHRSYGRDYPGELADPYIDDVAYWDGESFHPSRESIPGKSILRQSSPHSKHQRPVPPAPSGHHRQKQPRPQYQAPPGIDGIPRMPLHNRLPISYYSEPSVSREYFKMDPYRYLVREYGQRLPSYEHGMFEEESDNDSDDRGTYPRRYDNYAEERRLRSYLDEAVKAAQSMKRYTKRISELCEQKKFEDNFAHLSAERNYRDYYSQYS